MCVSTNKSNIAHTFAALIHCIAFSLSLITYSYIFELNETKLFWRNILNTTNNYKLLHCLQKSTPEFRSSQISIYLIIINRKKSVSVFSENTETKQKLNWIEKILFVFSLFFIYNTKKGNFVHIDSHNCNYQDNREDFGWYLCNLIFCFLSKLNYYVLN
jgi:hypothetical protein